MLSNVAKGMLRTRTANHINHLSPNVIRVFINSRYRKNDMSEEKAENDFTYVCHIIINAKLQKGGLLALIHLKAFFVSNLTAALWFSFRLFKLRQSLVLSSC